MLIGDIPIANARFYPERTAIVDERHCLTWSEFNSRVNRLANALLASGLRPGARAALVCENRLEYAEFLFASAKCGVVSVHINHRFTPDKIGMLLTESHPDAVFVEDKFTDTIRQVVSSLDYRPQFVVIGEGGDYEKLLTAAPDTEPEVALHEDDVLLLIFSTGTTGMPKGIELTHRNWLANARARFWITRLSVDDVYLVATPLFTAGSLGHFFGAAYAATKVVTCVFSGETFATMVAREGVTTTFLSLAVYRLVRDYLDQNPGRHDLSSLNKLASAGGQPCRREQLKEMLDFFGVPYANSSKTYSMSEISTVGSWLLGHEIAAGLQNDATEVEKQRLNSVGKAIGSTLVRIVDDADCDLPPGKTGEILFQSDGLMRGYLNKPELNEQVLRSGWYHSGDLGYLDADGYLYLVGRKDFLIKSGGFFVSAEEVEKIIETHPAVAEVGVLGIPHEKWGETVKAVVKLKTGAAATVTDIRDHCRGQLSGFQIPKLVEFVDELPRESTFGKISRTELARRYRQA